MTHRELPTEGDDPVRPVVHDRRRVDPETGQVREPVERPAPSGALAAEGAAADGGLLAAAQAEAAERLDDLRRVQAEYLNYRRRVERDREAVREAAVASVLGEFLGVLDDIGRARDHGDLTGAFRTVAESLEATVAKLGLQRFGDPGDPFDPTVHEALMHEYSDEVEVPTCTQILMPGYRYGSRIIRPARVAVAEPTIALPEPDQTQAAPLLDVDDE
ncbi:MAG: nucleotide exchange factor GrpE [Jiangellaceae bacterium]|nr:nucleotide exchange factor GrpE [Jiangellaceae bacterium]